MLAAKSDHNQADQLPKFATGNRLAETSQRSPGSRTRPLCVDQ
jgi:hypothetical protein